MQSEITEALEEYVNLTKTDDTKNKYLKRAEQLLKKCKLELEVLPKNNIDIRQFVIWLVEKKQFLARSSWRQYKSATIFYLEEKIKTENDTVPFFEALEYIKNITAEGAIKKSTKTSATKLKKINTADLIRLEDFLEKRNSKWSKELIVWLKAAMLTGLRPSEWRHAKIIKTASALILRVKNGKGTNNRSHGLDRTIILNHLDEGEIDLIKQHLHNVSVFSDMGEYEYFYRGCYVTLYKACRECWTRRKRHLSLYSARHQFSANAKFSGLNSQEIAALMGHATDDTATIHYGKKSAGEDTVKVLPCPEDIKKIKVSNKTIYVQGSSEVQEKNKA